MNAPASDAPARPFPQNLNYAGCSKPEGIDQATLNADIKAFYDYYRRKYFKPSNGVTPGGGYYLDRPDNYQGGNYKTISEAHGYGMIIIALMAGYDAEARELFDGFYNFYHHHRSRSNPHLMTWVVPEDEGTLANDSATDGDMDIAYALLLAHTQWGSAGRVNYLAEAKRIITLGIKAANIGPTFRTLLGDWDKSGLNTRSSDWMPGHFQAYYEATADADWLKVRDTAFDLIASLTRSHAPLTGLMPDFVVGDPPQPAPANFLERQHDDAYSWNACRVPLRLAADYAHYGSPQALAALLKMTQWMRVATADDPAAIKAGYSLSGEALSEDSRMAFTAPFLAGCIADPQAGDFLRRGWPLLGKPASYYGEALEMLSMLLISGNWWVPLREVRRAGTDSRAG